METSKKRHKRNSSQERARHFRDTKKLFQRVQFQWSIFVWVSLSPRPPSHIYIYNIHILKFIIKEFENQLVKRFPKADQFGQFIFHQLPKTKHRRGPLSPSLTQKNLRIKKTSINLLPDSLPPAAAELRCYGNAAGWGHNALSVFIIIFSAVESSLMQGHCIYSHFIDYYCSNIFIPPEGLKGHGEWVPIWGEGQPRGMELCRFQM